jgi:phosphohistidine phosphatase
MYLYLLRHGIAEDHGARQSDAERKLLQEGKDKTRDVMDAIAEMKYAVPDLVVSSTLVRAKETAQIAISAFAKNAEFKESEALTPMADVMDTMMLIEDAFRKHKVVMFVGHEPHMSSLGSALLGLSRSGIEMKKSAVALFELLNAEAPRVRGVLVGLFPPRVGNLS